MLGTTKWPLIVKSPNQWRAKTTYFFDRKRNISVAIELPNPVQMNQIRFMLQGLI